MTYEVVDSARVEPTQGIERQVRSLRTRQLTIRRAKRGWHRRVALAMLAHVYRAALHRAAIGGVTADLAADLLPLTVPKIRHLLAALVGRPLAHGAVILRRSV